MEYGCTPHYLRLCLGISREQAREASINFVVFMHSSRLHKCPLFVSRSFRHLCVYWKWKMVNALSDFTYRYADIPWGHDCTELMCCVMYYLNKYQCVTVSYHLYIKTGVCGYCQRKELCKNILWQTLVSPLRRGHSPATGCWCMRSRLRILHEHIMVVPVQQHCPGGGKDILQSVCHKWVIDLTRHGRANKHLLRLNCFCVISVWIF